MLRLDRKSPIPLYLQVSKQLKEIILRGDIFVGKRLPSTRKLALSLGLDRSTVLLAYNELYSEGLIEGHVGRGTIVAEVSRTEGQGFEIPVSLRWDDFFASSNYSAYGSFIQKYSDVFEERDIISLAGGVPPGDMLPAMDIRKIIAKLFRSRLNSVLGLSTCQGFRPLRDLLASDMIREGTPTSPEEIIITSGALQGLSLLSRALLDPGDLVLVEKPTFYGAIQIFKAAQAEIIGIPVDAQGMRVDALEKILAGRKPKLLYTIPTYHNPSGTVLSLDRRKVLLNLAYRHQFGIIEEDPCSSVFFEKAPPPSLKSLDQHAAVIYVSSFSKPLFPGLRVGWAVCTRQLARRLAMIRQYEDMHVNTLGQHFFLEFIKAGCYERHLARMRKVVGRRRDAMLSALSRYCAWFMTWNKPEGGFFIWCRLNENLRSNELTEGLNKKKVAAIPGTAFFLRPEEGADRLRLAFSYESEERLEKGVRILGQVAKSMSALAQSKPDIHEVELKGE